MEVDKLLAYCGLKCGGCQIYLATRETEKEKQAKMRVQMAEFISEEYGISIKPKDVTACDGCRATRGRLGIRDVHENMKREMSNKFFDSWFHVRALSPPLGDFAWKSISFWPTVD